MTDRKHYPLIRTIYLYLFALLGLVLLVIGGVRFLDMGLKAFIFTKAEEDQEIMNYQVPLPYSISRIEKIQQKIENGEEICFSQDEEETLKQWLVDYKNWKERRSKINYVTVRRHRNASLNLAMILAGLPLYLYHWRIIRRETKDGK